ncbi:MAG TPA: hypothetical protein VF228_02070 [Iamia sp.]
MTYPPATPGPSGGHDATQSFPAGGAPPPPPPVDPGTAPSHDATGVLPSAAGYGGYSGYGPPAGGGYTPPPAPAPPAPGGRRQGRILGRALLVLVVIGALAGTTAWGFVNRSSAEEWKERSEAADADLEEALERVEVTGADLEDARARLRDLANEKAGETDRNRILSEIVAQAPEVTAALADCQQETTALANDIIAAFGDPAADVAGLQARTDEVNEICAAALEQAEQLEDSIDALGI